MMASNGSYDVIVIGGGFAGVTAARDLGKEGFSVLLLEGRDRLGGRTWYRPFANTEQDVEFGGTWIAPKWQPHMAAEIERYGEEFILSPDPSVFTWSLGGEKSTGPLPIPVDEWLEFERAIVTIDNAAARLRFGELPLDQKGLEDLDVPFKEWLDAWHFPRKTSEFLLAWAGFYFGASPTDVSALHILSWVAGFNNSSLAWYVGVSEKLAHGTKSLIDAIAADSSAEVRLENPAHVVDASRDSVAVTTRTGENFSAQAAVIAVPINTWHSIEFRPGLGESKAAMAREKQTGHSIKIWALVRGLPGNFYGVGYDTKIKWLATEYNTPQGDLLVGFGESPDDLDVTDGDAITAAVREFIPDADVVATDAHDWNNDEFAQGTWMAYRPGQVMRYASALQQPEGRLAFAGSDLASGWAGWMEGAVESGHRAARHVSEIIGAATIA
jgi:monoamine oxidase